MPAAKRIVPPFHPIPLTPAALILAILLAWVLTTAGAAEPPPATRPAARHLVFAHYMVCYATYGEKLESYQREIREAQAAGIQRYNFFTTSGCATGDSAASR